LIIRIYYQAASPRRNVEIVETGDVGIWFYKISFVNKKVLQNSRFFCADIDERSRDGSLVRKDNIAKEEPIIGSAGEGDDYY